MAATLSGWLSGQRGAMFSADVVNRLPSRKDSVGGVAGVPPKKAGTVEKEKCILGRWRRDDALIVRHGPAYVTKRLG